MAGGTGDFPRTPFTPPLAPPLRKMDWSAIGRGLLNDPSGPPSPVDGETGGPRSDEEDEFFRSGG